MNLKINFSDQHKNIIKKSFSYWFVVLLTCICYYCYSIYNAYKPVQEIKTFVSLLNTKSESYIKDKENLNSDILKKEQLQKEIIRINWEISFLQEKNKNTESDIADLKKTIKFKEENLPSSSKEFFDTSKYVSYAEGVKFDSGSFFTTTDEEDYFINDSEILAEASKITNEQKSLKNNVNETKDNSIVPVVSQVLPILPNIIKNIPEKITQSSLNDSTGTTEKPDINSTDTDKDSPPNQQNIPNSNISSGNSLGINLISKSDESEIIACWNKDSKSVISPNKNWDCLGWNNLNILNIPKDQFDNWKTVFCKSNVCTEDEWNRIIEIMPIVNYESSFVPDKVNQSCKKTITEWKNSYQTSCALGYVQIHSQHLENKSSIDAWKDFDKDRSDLLFNLNWVNIRTDKQKSTICKKYDNEDDKVRCEIQWHYGFVASASWYGERGVATYEFYKTLIK